MVVENRFFRSKRTRRTLKKKKGRAYMNMGNSIIDFNEKKGEPVLPVKDGEEEPTEKADEPVNVIY